MNTTLRQGFSAALLALAMVGYSQSQQPATTGAHSGAQSAADVLRDAAGTDGAFLAAGLIEERFSVDNLASLLLYPADEVVVVKLKGQAIRQALERSVSLYPQPNSSFLQISGFTVEFSAAGEPRKRVLNVTAGGLPLDENRVYTIAMPSSLGRGGLGYFKIWDKTSIDRTLPGQTMESVLKGRKVATTSPRWVQR